jgi:hypothetical protein
MNDKEFEKHILKFTIFGLVLIAFSWIIDKLSNSSDLNKEE